MVPFARARRYGLQLHIASGSGAREKALGPFYIHRPDSPCDPQFPVALWRALGGGAPSPPAAPPRGGGASVVSWSRSSSNVFSLSSTDGRRGEWRGGDLASVVCSAGEAGSSAEPSRRSERIEKEGIDLPK